MDDLHKQSKARLKQLGNLLTACMGTRMGATRDRSAGHRNARPDLSMNSRACGDSDDPFIGVASASDTRDGR